MSVARTGVYVDDYAEHVSSLPPDLQRTLSTMQELDNRATALQNQIREQMKMCIHSPHQSLKKTVPEPAQMVARLRREIETNQANYLQLCTEKVVLAKQMSELIDSHSKRLDEDLVAFEDELRQEGKDIPAEEPFPPPQSARVAMMPTPGMPEKRKSSQPSFPLPPPGKRPEVVREKEREREDGPPVREPTQRKRSLLAAPQEGDEIDPNEPTYCVCGRVSFGEMVNCDNKNCRGGEWFHYECVGLDTDTVVKGKWYCPDCKSLQKKGLLESPL